MLVVPYSVGKRHGPLKTTMPNVFHFLSAFAGPAVIERVTNYLLIPVGQQGCSSINRIENMLCPTPPAMTTLDMGILFWNHWETHYGG